MQVFQDKLGHFFTEKDYAPMGADLASINWSFENARYIVEAEDFVASVPGFMSLEELDNDLKDWGMVSRLWAPKHYVVSRILGEDWGHDNFSQILGLNLMHVDSSCTKTGGKVIKNVSGYDLAKLYIGSRSKLALIENCFLRLEKLASHKANLVLELNFQDNSFFSNKLIHFLVYLSQHNFDNTLLVDMQIKKELDYKFVLKLELSADQEMLELRVDNLKNKLNEFFVQNYKLDVLNLINVELKPYSKSYPSEANRIELHLANDQIRYFYLSLLESFNDISLDLKKSIINIKVDKLEEELERFRLKHAELELGPYFMNIYPVTYKTIDLEKKYNPYFNKTEEDILLAIKKQLDPRSLLNAV